MQKDLLTVEDITVQDLKHAIQLAGIMKRHRGTYPESPLLGKSIGLIFAKASTRTRVSFEVGIRELGGFAIYLDSSSLQLGRGETMTDTARVLSRYLHGIIIRTSDHQHLVDFARCSNIPVINALTDDFHPCQILADLFTVYEYSEGFEGVKMAYFGDCASNVANSLILGARLSGISLVLSSPEAYRPSPDLLKDTTIGPGKVSWEPDPKKAAAGVDYLYTDAWVSMGFEKEKDEREAALRPYQLNRKLLDLAAGSAKIMHCLPAHRGKEITDDVLDCTQSIVLEQAENRLHVQKALLAMILNENWRRLLE
jgi:ornithine carbamoyltransferase